MQGRYRCPRCFKRRPSRGARCNGCGVRLSGSTSSTGRGTIWLLLFLIAVAGIPVVIGHADRFIPALSEWYLDATVPNAVKPPRRLVPGPPIDGAFDACVKRAAKESGRNGNRGVVTFASESESIVTRIDDDLMIISSGFEELAEDGTRGEGEFCCVARKVEGSWRVESLRVRRSGEQERNARYQARPRSTPIP